MIYKGQEVVRGKQRLAVQDHSDSPLRAQLAAVLASERRRRQMSMQEFVAHITAFTDGEKFSYRTYFLAVRKEQNLTLRTIALFSHALDISIAELLFPETKKWMRVQNEEDIKRHIARVVERYRVTHRLHRKELRLILGISMVTYTKIDRAEQNLTLDTIEQMADHLKMPVQDLFFGKI